MFITFPALAFAAACQAATFVLALTEQVQLAIIGGFVTIVTTTIAAVLTWLTRREVQRGHVEAREDRQRIERKVDAPRTISADREEGVRVEGPQTGDRTPPPRRAGRP